MVPSLGACGRASCVLRRAQFLYHQAWPHPPSLLFACLPLSCTPYRRQPGLSACSCTGIRVFFVPSNAQGNEFALLFLLGFNVDDQRARSKRWTYTVSHRADQSTPKQCTIDRGRRITPPRGEDSTATRRGFMKTYFRIHSNSANKRAARA